jgi:Cft2 family RNA processing exonuclease
MSSEEFKFQDKPIEIEEQHEFAASYKIQSYKAKLQYMEQKKIPQKPLYETITDLFLKSELISQNCKASIQKISFSNRDRIIILFTDSGKEIIWNRDKLINEYGWFFFVSKPKIKDSSRKKKKKRKEKVKEEITISEKPFPYEDLSIILKEKSNMRSLYKTKEYFHFIKLIESKNIPQLNIKEVLNDFFFHEDSIPIKEKKSIRKIIYYEKEKLIVIKSLIGDKMYESLERLVRKYGWYLYITGVPVGKSDISIAIDKIEKRYGSDYFNTLSVSSNGTDAKICIYPIVLKPNHNCHILNIGRINILLDCGITETIIEDKSTDNEASNGNQSEEENEDRIQKVDDFEYIKEYLEKLPLLIKEAQEGNPESNATPIKDEGVLIKNHIEKLSSSAHITNAFENYAPKVDAIFISHSHYDHVSGLKKFIELYPDVPILCSRITLDLFLLRDSNFLKQESHEEIEEKEYQNIIKNVIFVENGEKIGFKEKNCYISFFHAGHMPGALMFLAKINDFRFLYTGDYTFYDITPFAGTRRFLEQISKPIDYLLIDGTCANEDHGNVSDQFHSLILFLEQKAEYEDNVLIGADPSSLAITFMLIFWRYFRKLQLKKGYKKRPNIYVDMMVRKNIQVINHRFEYIYGPISRLIRDKANPFNSIKFRWFNINDLDFVKEKNNIIISHPPDLSYGIIRNIINMVGRSPHNLVFLAGSIHEEPGESLVNGSNEIVFSETWKVPFRALLVNKFVPQLKIKLHADKNQLAEMIKALEPKEVCFFHQSAKNLIEVVDYVKELGVGKVSLPRKRRLKILN